MWLNLKMDPRLSSFFFSFFPPCLFLLFAYVCHLFCIATMVPYPQLQDQQESGYLDHGRLLSSNFLFPFCCSHCWRRSESEIKPLEVRSGIKDLTSYWRTETSLIFRSPWPELCLVRRGWEKLRRDEDCAWLLWQEIEAMHVVSADLETRGDNEEWQPPCANGSTVSLFQWSHPDDIIAPSRKMSQWLIQEIHQIICCCSRIYCGPQWVEWGRLKHL